MLLTSPSCSIMPRSNQLQRQNQLELLNNPNQNKFMKKNESELISGVCKIWKSKFIKRMKIVALLILISITQTFALDTYAQNKRLSLHAKNETIVNILEGIEDQSEFFFMFDASRIDVNQRKNVDCEKQLITNILDQLFEDTGITYSIIKNRQVLLTAIDKSDTEQQNSISGKVTDSSGQPLPGVTVVVKNTTQGTITNADGEYSLTKLPANAILQFSFVGMRTQEIAVADNKTINVILEGGTVGINEVVVTALGIKREQKALGYSVQKIDGESLQKVSGVDVGTSLTGKVAGLLVENSTDFNVEPSITIRGETPLLVIDGIPYVNKELNDIPAEDIESMSVLKGATASALYGFRGASGAIIVTTKNGSSSQIGTTVEANSNTMFSAGFLAIPKQQSMYGRGNTNVYDKNSVLSWGTVMDGTIREQWDPFLKEYREYEYLPIGKNNFRNFLEPGYITNNNINVAFRGNKMALRSSLNWTQNKGRYPNSILNKYTYSLGGDINLDKFKLSSNVSYSKRYTPNMGANGFTSYEPMFDLLIYSSTDYNILDYKNNYWLVKDVSQNWTFANSRNNPYFDKYEKINSVSRDIFNANLSTSYDLTEWLNVTARSGLDFYVESGEIKVSQGSYLNTGNTNVPGTSSTFNGILTGAYIAGKTQGFSINSDLLFTGNKTFLDKLNIDYLLGGTILYHRTDNINASTDGGISIPGYFSLNASVNPVKVGASTRARQVNSAFGRLSLSWDKLMYFEATGRNDWSSTLAGRGISKSNMSYFYPSFATSFVISELLPESTKNWLDMLKIRNSWTQSKTPANIYAINSVYTVVPNTWNEMTGASASTSLYDVNNIHPETANTYEVGLQGFMFKKCLSVDLTYYSKREFDFLVYADVSSASGVSSSYVNTNEERTRKGWEVAIGATPVKRNNFQWDVALNWSTYKRVYTKLDETYTPKDPWIKVGNRVDAFTIRDFLKVPDGEYAGQIIYRNGRVQRSGYWSVYGYSDPDWIWGLNSTLKYKDFSLYFSLDGVVGGLMNSQTESAMWLTGVHPASLTPERALDVANPGTANYLGDGVQITSGTVTYDSYGNITSDTREYAPNDSYVIYRLGAQDLHYSSPWSYNPNPNSVLSKTFLKLREVSLTYSVPHSIINKWGGYIKNASVGFVGQNVFLWAKDFKYSDPDGGKEDFADPSVRYLGFNIKLTF